MIADMSKTTGSARAPSGAGAAQSGAAHRGDGRAVPDRDPLLDALRGAVDERRYAAGKNKR